MARTTTTTASAIEPGSWAHTGEEVAPGIRTGGMVPPQELLPETLPHGSLSESGRPRPPLRDELRRIPNLRNVGNVLAVWLQSFGVVALAIWIDRPVAYAAAFLLMGRAFALFGILTHEAAHRLLFSNKRANDFVGRWLLGYPGFIPLDIYRRGHMAHHRDEFGPDEPDLVLYANYPVTRASMRRKLLRDAFFVSGWSNLKALLVALGSKRGRPVATRIIAVQLVLWATLWVVGAWWVYPILWLAPWMTVWRVINRLRAIAEHGGMQRSDDRRETTHHVEQGLLARFWFVPYNTGWHLAHHVDSGVPFQHLPRLHDGLVAAGWVRPEVIYPNYRALWRTLASG